MSFPVWRVSLYIAWCFITWCISTVQGQQTYFCENGVTQTINDKTRGVIKTRTEENGFYGNNLLCSWVIEAAENSRIKLTIDVRDLQWSSIYSTCTGYDNLQILEGRNNKGGIIASVCGARDPYNVVSKGRYLFLQFSSTHQNFAKNRGVELTFETFENNTCPPGWFQASNMPDECLMIGVLGTSKWIDSQDICTYSQANLASITSATEYNTILAQGKNQSVAKAWIGLSVLGKNGSPFSKWVDTVPVDYKRSSLAETYNKKCVLQDFESNSWKVDNCDTKLNYICKAKKDGSTILYPAMPSSGPPEEESHGTKTYLIVIIVVVVILLIFAAVLVYCCCYRKQGTRSRSPEEIHEVESTEMITTPVPHNQGAPPAYNDIVPEYKGF